MANLVVSPIYRLEDFAEAYPMFQAMKRMCEASFRKNLKGMDDFVVLGNQDREFKSFVEMFEDVYRKLKGLWVDGHNLFFTDIDALCIRPFEAFGIYQEFRCFSLAENDNPFPDQFPAYFLSGSRYFPQTMNPSLWDIGDGLWKNPTDARRGSGWDYEQYIYNMMFYSQPGVQENWELFVINHFNYFCGWSDSEDATVIAFNAAAQWRNGHSMQPVLDQMERWMENYGIQVESGW